MNFRNNSGFSLVEVMVTVGMLVIVSVGLLRLFFFCSALSETAGNTTLAMSAAQDKIEEMKNYTYSSIVTDYASGGAKGNTFDVTRPVGKGVIYINSSNANLLTVTIDVNWKNHDNRIIGEDLDLDGAIDAGEDVNNNLQLDSMTTIGTLIAKR